MALDPGTIAATAAAYANRHPRDILALALKEYAPDLAISFSGAEDVVLVDMAAKLGGHVPGLLAGHRAPASGDLPVHREGARPLRHPDRHLLPATGSRPGAGAREGTVLLLPGRPQGMLRHPQGRAADARARVLAGVGHRPAQGSESRALAAMYPSSSSIRRSGRPIGRSSSSTRSARGPRSRCGITFATSGPVQHAARSRLRLDRL